MLLALCLALGHEDLFLNIFFGKNVNALHFTLVSDPFLVNVCIMCKAYLGQDITFG